MCVKWWWFYGESLSPRTPVDCVSNHRVVGSPLLNIGTRRAFLFGAIGLLFTAVVTRVEVVKPFQKKWHIAAEHPGIRSKLYRWKFGLDISASVKAW